MAPGGIETLVLDLVANGHDWIFSLDGTVDELTARWPVLSAHRHRLVAFNARPGLHPTLIWQLRANIRRLAPASVTLHHVGRREVLGMEVGPSEAEPFWTKFLRSLTNRGLRGVKLVISDSHEGLKAAARKVLSATWQRCCVHFMRNAMATVNFKQRGMVAAAIRSAFVQETEKEAHAEWCAVADRLRERFPRTAAIMDDAEYDVLAYMFFPKSHWPQIRSTNPIERLNLEVKRRTNVVQIFPNEAAIVRLVGALLLEQNDEWAVCRRYMNLETLARLSHDAEVRPTAIPAA